jgi:hypothetical protein
MTPTPEPATRQSLKWLWIFVIMCLLAGIAYVTLGLSRT